MNFPRIKSFAPPYFKPYLDSHVFHAINRHIVAFLLGFSLIVCVCHGVANAKNGTPPPPYAHIVFDADTGRVLSQKNADQSIHPASLTKMMTLLMTFDALKAKKITTKSRVIMTSHAANMPPSKLGIKAGQSIAVDDAIRALVTKSANDVATALGEKLGGSERGFAQMMNKRARSIGMTQTYFVNASGLHNSRQVSSARDMGKLGLYIQKTYPQYYPYFSLRSFRYGGKEYKNHNKLLTSYQGMDGFKTGYIRQSGFNLVASAKRGKTRLIGVVIGGASSTARNARMEDLLDAGFGRRNFIPDERTQNYASVFPKTAPILTLPAPSKPEGTTTAYASQRSFQTKDSQTLGYLKKPTYTNQQAQTSTPEQASLSEGWSIQVGAYQDRISTDQAIFNAIRKLPSPLNRGRPLVIPLRTANNAWVFRARITGFTYEQAMQACRYLDDCLTLSPMAN